MTDSELAATPPVTHGGYNLRFKRVEVEKPASNKNTSDENTIQNRDKPGVITGSQKRDTEKSQPKKAKEASTGDDSGGHEDHVIEK